MKSVFFLLNLLLILNMWGSIFKVYLGYFRSFIICIYIFIIIFFICQAVLLLNYPKIILHSNFFRSLFLALELVII